MKKKMISEQCLAYCEGRIKKIIVPGYITKTKNIIIN